MGENCTHILSELPLCYPAGREDFLLKTGISTACLYPMETEQALALLLSLGYRRFEVFLNAFEELEKPFLGELKRRAEEYGASFCSVHPFTSPMESLLLFGEYSRRTEEGFRLYGRYAEAAAYLGGKYVVLHGQRQGAGPLSEEAYWERFGQLTRFLASSGARPAQENVRDHRSSDPDFIKGMREYLQEDCAFVLDVKQCVQSGCTPKEMAEAMGNRLAHVHLSDHKPGAPCLLPGAGAFDFSSFRKTLKGISYQETIVTEVYRRNFSQPEELEAARLMVESCFSDDFFS